MSKETIEKIREQLIVQEFVNMCSGSINPDLYETLVNGIVPSLKLSRKNLKRNPDLKVKEAREFMGNYVAGEPSKSERPAGFNVIQSLMDEIWHLTGGSLQTPYSLVARIINKEQ